MPKTPSITNSFTTHLRHALAKSMDFAMEFGHKEVTCSHLLFGLAVEKGALSSEMLMKIRFPLDLLKQHLIRKHNTPYITEPTMPELDDSVVTVLTKAVRTAHLHRHAYIGTEHVLACLLNKPGNDLADLLAAWQINTNELARQLMMVLKSTSKFPDLTETLRELQSVQTDPQDEHSDFPLLEALATEMTTSDYLKKCAPLIGRDHEIERLQQILCRRYKNNPMLVGQPGVGKTAIVEGLAQAILGEKTSHKLHNMRIFSLEMSSLVAGTIYRGDFEGRMRALVEELRNNPDIILFIDEIHALVGAGSNGQPLDAANILKPALARGEIRCIGATTFNEFQKHFSKDQALTRRFQMIPVHESSYEETKEILHGVKKIFEDYHKVSITPDAIDSALDLSERYLTHTCWPDKAIDLLDEAASQSSITAKPDASEGKKQELKKKISKLQKDKLKFLNNDQYKKAIDANDKTNKLLEELENFSDTKTRRSRITGRHIRQAVATRTGMQEDRLSIKAEPIAQGLFERLNQTIIGQEPALKQITSAIQRGYSLLKESHKPVGAYLFLGPSGVGKTSTAKALAKELFGSDKALIRLDMSEFAEKHTISKLIGAPAGYVGYQESGILTKAVKQRPLSVVLFDEIEKAHPDIFNLLLQILDEGQLTDGSGETIEFRHTIIILTSNLGVQEIHKQVGFSSSQSVDTESIQSTIKSAIKDFFRIELLNRLNDIVYFQPLGIAQRQAIIDLKLQNLNNRLGDHIQIQLSDQVMHHFINNAYNEEQGVRSLEKIMRETIEIPLSENLWKYKKGTKVQLKLKDGIIKMV